MLYVTGITGHSGKWFLKRLEAENYQEEIRCAMRHTKEDAPEKYELFSDTKLNISFAIGDLEDENFLQESLEGVDTIVHIASISLSEKLIDAAIEAGVKWAILVHTTGRFSQFKSASAGYIQIEDGILQKRDKIDITILRPTMIYGSSGDRNMYRLVTYLDHHKLFPVFGDGSNLMQPVHAKDLGNAYYDVLIRADITKNKEYNLSGKEPVTYGHIIKIISKYLNKKTKLINIPFSLSVTATKIYNGILGKHAIISVEQVLRMKEDKAFSHEAAAKDFGYSPYAFDEGIKMEVEEYLSGIRVDFSEIKYQ